jgi:2-keto-3-deoxy-L-rhamnonate aldolase RhmA
MKLLWQQIPSSEITTIYCHTSFDGVVLDDEHGCFNNETLVSLIRLINANDRLSFVRLTEPSKSKIRMLLDAGVYGLIFSTVENQEQVKNIVNNCFYPPKGKRGQGLVGENLWGQAPELLQKVNPVIIAQIETQKGINYLPLINELFDYYMLGPYDLTADLGCIADWNNLEYQEAVHTFNSLIPKSKRAVHIVSDIENEFENKFKDYGLVALGMDTTMLINSLNTIKKYA